MPPPDYATYHTNIIRSNYLRPTITRVEYVRISDFSHLHVDLFYFTMQTSLVIYILAFFFTAVITTIILSAVYPENIYLSGYKHMYMEGDIKHILVI